MKIAKNIASVLLGGVFVFASVMYFVMMAKGTVLPEMTGIAGEFSHSLMVSGFMTVVKVFEFVLGVMILVPKTRKLALVMIAPISLNIYLYEVLIQGSIGAGLVLVALNLFVLFGYRDAYRSMVE